MGTQSCISSFVILLAGIFLLISSMILTPGLSSAQAAQQMGGATSISAASDKAAVSANGQIKKAKVVRKDLVLVPEGSQIPAEFDDIMGIKVISTSQSTFDILVDYAAADHSNTLMLAAILLQNGQTVAGGNKPAIVTPGKGQAVVKMAGAPDPFNQVDVILYEVGGTPILKKRFDYSASSIGSVLVTKKSVTEYAIKVNYNLAATYGSFVLLGATLLDGGAPVAFWEFTPVKVTPGQGNAELKMNWTGQSTTPTKFNQVKVMLYTKESQEIFSKTVNYPAADSTASDEINNFKAIAATSDSLDFKVDYAYKSNQGNNVKVTAKVMSGGYPVDWLKCSLQYVQKGSGSAALKCNFGSAQTMPPGIYEMPSNQILVQLQGDGNSSPILSKSFNFQKTWSLDDLSNFRITGKTDTEIDFLVDYAYKSSHGNLVGIGAKAIIGGVIGIQVFAPTQNIEKGTGTAAGRVVIPPGGKPVEQVFAYLYGAGGSEFYSKTFDYPKTGAAVSAKRTGITTAALQKVNLENTGRKIGKPESFIAPEQPLKLAAQAMSATSVMLKWNPKNPGVKEFRIERKDSRVGFTVLETIGTTSAEYTDASVKPDNSYTYRILAIPVKGEPVYSNDSVVKTPAFPTRPGTMPIRKKINR